MAIASFRNLSDSQLVAEVARLTACERQATATLIASLAELDARRLYLGAGCSSLFTYCTTVLHLSEHAAYGRIEAARAARRFPAILDHLADGSLTLTTVCLIAPHMTETNHGDLLTSARGQSKRAVEHLVARLRPLPDVPAAIRKLPTPRAAQSSPPSLLHADSPPSPHTHKPIAPFAADRPAVIAPLAPERYKLQVTVGRETHDKLQRARDLLRHRIPSGDLAEILDRALTLLIAEVERSKCAAADRPQAARTGCPHTRHIPAAVRRDVWKRDGGRCAFVGTDGRCSECGYLEFHHIVPFAAGGQSTVENLSLRCRAHNGYETEVFFGPGSAVRA